MGVSGPSRINGTYHVAVAQRERVRRTRVLIFIGVLVALLGLVNVVLINHDMTGIEEAGPQRLALAGGGVAHFVPSILSSFQRAQQSPTTVQAVDPADPRHSLPFVEDKRALERWMAFTGLGLATLLIGLEGRIASSTAHPRSPTGTDLSRLLILISLSYAALSFFESG